MTFFARAVLLFVALSLALSAQSEPFRFSRAFGDHMVLQRSPDTPTIWGYNNGPAQISVALTGDDFDFNGTVSAVPSTINSSNYVWKISLPPRPAGGPYIIASSNGAELIQIVDVYFGDVFVCGGQSNMQFTVPNAFNASKEIKAANNYPLIRLFVAAEFESDSAPLEDFEAVSLPWSVASAETVTNGQAKEWAYFSAVCWFYGRDLFDLLNTNGETVPIGLIESCVGGTLIETWSSMDSLEKCGWTSQEIPNEPAGPNSHASSLYNAMIVPLLNVTIKSFLWYQGEQNVLEAQNYSCTFPNLIADYRTKWSSGSGTKPSFPFVFVQLAGYCLCSSGPYKYYCNTDIPTSLVADLRWAQTANYGYVPNPQMPNVFMAVAYDLADPTAPFCDIHPRNKQEVGRRAALVSWCGIYKNPNSLCIGPIPISAKVSQANHGAKSTWTLTVTFSATDGPSTNLQWLRFNNLAVGFEFAFANDFFAQADFVSVGNSSATVTATVPTAQGTPTSVRYAWRDRPCSPYFNNGGLNCQIYYYKGLPLYPFDFPIQSNDLTV